MREQRSVAGDSDETGFSAVTGGYYDDGSIVGASYSGMWWSATAHSGNQGQHYYSQLSSGNVFYGGFGGSERYGLYVRCIKSN